MPRITDRDITLLRREAEEHGDLEQAMLCVLALGGPEALEGAEPGTEADLLLERGTTQAQARELCEEAIESARAQVE